MMSGGWGNDSPVSSCHDCLITSANITYHYMIQCWSWENMRAESYRGTQRRVQPFSEHHFLWSLKYKLLKGNDLWNHEWLWSTSQSLCICQAELMFIELNQIVREMRTHHRWLMPARCSAMADSEWMDSAGFMTVLLTVWHAVRMFQKDPTASHGLIRI